MLDKAEYLEAWLKKARTDYKLFLLVQEQEDDMLDAAGYHAQQAIEKWLKTLLILHDITPPRTHDLTRLVGMLTHKYPSLSEDKWIRWATTIGDLVVETRYPDPDEPKFLIRHELSQIREALEAFRTFTKAQLGNHWAD